MHSALLGSIGAALGGTERRSAAPSGTCAGVPTVSAALVGSEWASMLPSAE
jgi:hypothetical protein